MQTVIIRKYSTFFDPKTGTQFNPVLDRATGMIIGMAQVDDSQAARFQSDSAYELLTDSQYTTLLTGKSTSDTSVLSGKVKADLAALNADLSTSAPQPPK